MKPKILFLCTGNSCRSQMAEGLVKHLRGDRLEAYSAGIEKHGLNPLAIKVMEQIGIDISNYRSKTVDEIEDVEFDYVVTVCDHAQKTCPGFSAKGFSAKPKVVLRAFDDPPKLAVAEPGLYKQMQHYQRVRDEIKEYV
ncbi:MAG: arsenate reductase ArsC, partial [Planctomycetaceae bacterium]|nr:arsenate reductase ArsC [Planctomycetaceae bacterium]